jgi:anion-transporting  ArsA/GET3 family ATPase
LHLLLGAGGVGKTTLAAGYALALARAGGRVGLLGIDPARRLQGALGLALPDREVLVPTAGELHAALLCPEESLRRWAAEACPDREALGHLTTNAFFVALADRLAASTDVLAAIRLAEWIEHDPGLTDLVVDTAPGLNAVEFLRRPQSLTAFLEGRLVRWLRLLSRSQRGGVFGGALRGGARRALGGLARIAGTGLLLELADLLASVEGMLEGMLRRLERAQRWLREGPTELLLVTAVRDDAAAFARTLAEALAGLSLAPRAVVVNRVLPDALSTELGALSTELGALVPEAAYVTRYVSAYTAMQRRVIAAVAPLSPQVVVLPSARGLGEAGRLDALAALGEALRAELASARLGVGPAP